MSNCSGHRFTKSVHSLCLVIPLSVDLEVVCCCLVVFYFVVFWVLWWFYASPYCSYESDQKTNKEQIGKRQIYIYSICRISTCGRITSELQCKCKCKISVYKSQIQKVALAKVWITQKAYLGKYNLLIVISAYHICNPTHEECHKSLSNTKYHCFDNCVCIMNYPKTPFIFILPTMRYEIWRD